MPIDAAATIDRLIYWNELPFDVPAAQRLLGCNQHDRPPDWCLAFDFSRVDSGSRERLDHWCSVTSAEVISGLLRQRLFNTYPYLVYAFVWTGDDKQSKRRGPDNAARHLAEAARDAVGTAPAVGIGGPASEWSELRRSLQRATVGARLSWLHDVGLTGPREVELFLSKPRGQPLPSGPLLSALTGHDRQAVRTEADRIVSSYIEVFLSPLSTLRVQFIALLLRCGEAARSAGVTARLVDQWADHHLRSLWNIYSMGAMQTVVMESVAILATMVADVTDPDMPRAVASARALLISTWNETLSAARIAQELGLSTAHLSRLFNRHMDCSIPTFRNRVRIERATQELKTTDKSITEIAFACGFESLTHFNRVFCSQTGTSPTRYRRQTVPIETSSRIESNR